MLSNDKIIKIVQDCQSAGKSITVRDISYIFLCRIFDDKSVAYKSVFGTSDDVSVYDESDKIKFLKSYIDSNFAEKKKRKSSKTEDEITFEENKSEIIKLIKDTQTALDEGKIDIKDALKIQADLRVKLNDKFSVKEDVKEQVVIVNTKYDDICPNCHVEISRRPISKEEAMKMYGLVEKY